MSDEIWDDVALDAGEAYEKYLVSGVFAEWAPRLLALAGVDAGSRVLDVACGTGIVARTAIGWVGPSGSVVGLDMTASMLDTASRIEPSVEWCLGDAGDLPFADADFDAVVSQAGLMFFPDKPRAAAEMLRVLRPGGRVAILVWGRSAAYEGVTDTVRRVLGEEAAARYSGPWSYPDPEALRALVSGAGFTDVTVRVEPSMSYFASLDEFMAGASAILLHGTSDRAAVADAIAGALEPFRTDDGRYELPGFANIATATRR